MERQRCGRGALADQAAASKSLTLIIALYITQTDHNFLLGTSTSKNLTLKSHLFASVTSHCSVYFLNFIIY